jgi:anthranilate synthase component 2
MILLIDNFDSFTYNLADYITQCGAACTVVRNNENLTSISEKEYKAIVLSPGPQTPEKAGNLMQILDYYSTRLPILGICLGHQAIGKYFGASLEKAKTPMHGKISAIHFQPDFIFDQLPQQTTVVRYHSLILKELPVVLEAIAFSEQEEIMAIRHRTLPIRGLQFHPEAALTLHGLKMIQNWIKYNQIAG